MRDARGRTRNGNTWERYGLGDGCVRGRDVKWGTQASCVRLDANAAMHVDAGIQRFHQEHMRDARCSFRKKS